jgi:hypothetical protein
MRTSLIPCGQPELLFRQRLTFKLDLLWFDRTNVLHRVLHFRPDHRSRRAPYRVRRGVRVHVYLHVYVRLCAHLFAAGGEARIVMT